MKKKFLSLMMAAAVVATTSVNAFAANEKKVTNDGESVEVQINGVVNNSNDQPPAGTLSVTVPTALSFTVNKDGGFTGSDITVTNTGTQAIEVYAYQFIDPTPEKGIIVKQQLVAGTSKRNEVTLTLQGNDAIANFDSNAGSNKGIYGTATINGDGMKISTVGTGSQNTDTLYLRGTAGNEQLDQEYISTGMSEKFTLRLKIKKAPAQN